MDVAEVEMKFSQKVAIMPKRRCGGLIRGNHVIECVLRDVLRLIFDTLHVISSTPTSSVNCILVTSLWYVKCSCQSSHFPSQYTQ